MRRREFLKRGSGALAATMGASLIGVGCANRLWASMPRILGNTGLTPSFLGIGTGTHGWAYESDQTRLGTEPFVALLEHAYMRGVTYFDLADQYGSHEYMRQAMARSIPRDAVTIQTKTYSRDPDDVRADLDRFRLELDTDVLDIVLMHFVEESTWPEDFAECMGVLAEAKANGIIRAHGLSCHGLGPLARVPDEPWVDVLLARVNPEGVRMDGPVDDVVAILDQAHRNGKGILGMKILGEGALTDRIGECVQFAVDLPAIDAITIGFLSPTELDQAIDHIEVARPAG
ncbi:MAG: aldo/keto reductase [bacterium]|nr:aldo/keto reductase [bacterium]